MIFLRGCAVALDEIALIEQGGTYQEYTDFEHFAGAYTHTGKWRGAYGMRPAYCVHLKHSLIKIVCTKPGSDYDKLERLVLQSMTRVDYLASKGEIILDH